MIKYGYRQNEVNNIVWAIDEDDNLGTLNASASAPRGMGWDYVIDQLKETVAEHFNEAIDEAFKHRRDMDI